MRVTRRDVLRMGGAAAGGALIAGCGGATVAKKPKSSLPRGPIKPESADLQQFLAPVAGKYNPPITIKTVTSFVGTPKFNTGDTAANNPWTRAYQQKYGININHLWQAPAAQYSQKVDLMLSSGQLADYFPGADGRAYEVPSADSTPVTYTWQQPSATRYWVAGNGFKHPEALLAMLDF